MFFVSMGDHEQIFSGQMNSPVSRIRKHCCGPSWPAAAPVLDAGSKLSTLFLPGDSVKLINASLLYIAIHSQLHNELAPCLNMSEHQKFEFPEIQCHVYRSSCPNTKTQRLRVKGTPGMVLVCPCINMCDFTEI